VSTSPPSIGQLLAAGVGYVIANLENVVNVAVG